MTDGFYFSFFFQAEDGIRDYKVTGVQTCALPIWTPPNAPSARPLVWRSKPPSRRPNARRQERLRQPKQPAQPKPNPRKNSKKSKRPRKLQPNQRPSSP